MLFEYWKSKLNRNNRHLYDQMYSAFRSFKEEISCGEFGQRDIKLVYEAICNDHPELFYLSHAPHISQCIGLIGKSNKTLHVDFIFSLKAIKKYQNSIRTLCKTIETQIINLDASEKEKAICDFLIENCVYEINNKYNQNAATVLMKNKGQCSGIARATKLLLDYFNIESIIVTGELFDERTMLSGSHAWNLVRIKGEYYHLDVTSIIGCNISKSKPFNYIYYNCSDEELEKSHKWNKNDIPQCRSSYFKEKILTLNSLYELRELLKSTDYTHADTISFYSNIPSADINSLMRNVLQTTMGALRQMNKKIKVQVKIVGHVINIMFENI